MITTQEHLCWRIVTADGKDYDSGEGVQHFSDERDARDYAGDIPGATAKTLPAPCVGLACDDCGQDFEGDAFTFHFDNQAQAEDIAGKSDWIVTEDGKHCCWDCPVPVDEDEVEPAEAAR